MTESNAAQDPTFDLTGKVAVITGGSRGLGLAIAGSYARAGARVVIASRKGDACDQAAAALQSQTVKSMAALT